ncbi:MAG: hypothetical protein AB7F86_18085 [Bdellovibrionales bacterium]
MSRWLRILVAGSLLISNPAFATNEDEDKDEDKNDISQILDSMGYPELQVVPRASERLRMEAIAERGNWYVSHWPIQVSGLATLFVGATSSSNRKKDITSKEESDANTIALVTQAVGATWLVGTVLLGAQKPYRDGMRNISRHNGKDERSLLLRERLAEEALERPARIMRVLATVSMITNFSMNVASAVYADDKGKMYAGLGAILAFLPLMFQDPTIATHNKHIEYKKKIYAPLKGASVHYDPESKTLTPMTNLVWLF